MEPETTLPSRLPALSTPTSPLGHRGAVFPALEGSLPIRGRQKPSLAPPPCLLTSHATPSPNLVIGLGLPHSSHLALGSPLQPRAPATSRCSDTQGDRGERPAGPPQAPLFKDKTQRETAPSPGPSAARGWGSLAPLHWAALLPTGWHRAGQRRREVSTQRKPGLQAQKLPHLRACVTPGESLPLAGLVKAPP